jgi:putative transposase
MSEKRHTAEEIVTKLRQVDVLIAQGRSLAEVIRQISATEVAHYRWRNEYGGLKSDQVKRLEELEAENARLRQAVSDLNPLDLSPVLDGKSKEAGTMCKAEA